MTQVKPATSCLQLLGYSSSIGFGSREKHGVNCTTKVNANGGMPHSSGHTNGGGLVYLVSSSSIAEPGSPVPRAQRLRTVSFYHGKASGSRCVAPSRTRREQIQIQIQNIIVTQVKPATSC